MQAAPSAALLLALLPHWSRLLGLCQSQSERVTDDMLHTLAQLTPYVVHEPVASGMVSKLQECLQQQDRQRQMLELLTQDLSEAAHLSEDQVSRFNAGDWIDRFDTHCPIPELRRSHAPTSLSGDGTSDAGLEFF